MKHHEVDELLQNQDLPHHERQKLINRLKTTIEHNELLPQNRDGRGVRQSVRKLERTTVRHIGRALRHSKLHEDPQIQHAAKELIRSIPHLSFAPLAERASTFMGKVQKSSRRLKEQRRQASGQIIEVTGSVKLEEVRCVTFLQRVGKRLQLCVSDHSIARQHIDDIRNGSDELWVVRVEENVVGLLRICFERASSHRRRRSRRITSSRQRTIAECEGFDNETLYLSRDIALKILQCLNIDHVEAETFSQVGAFPILLQEDTYQPIPEPLREGSESHYVWRTRDHLLIATSAKQPWTKARFEASKMKWSYFWLDSDNEWVGSIYENHITLGKLLNLALHEPGFDRVLREIRGNSKEQ